MSDFEEIAKLATTEDLEGYSSKLKHALAGGVANEVLDQLHNIILGSLIATDSQRIKAICEINGRLYNAAGRFEAAGRTRRTLT